MSMWHCIPTAPCVHNITPLYQNMQTGYIPGHHSHTSISETILASSLDTISIQLSPLDTISIQLSPLNTISIQLSPLNIISILDSTQIYGYNTFPSSSCLERWFIGLGEPERHIQRSGLLPKVSQNLGHLSLILTNGAQGRKEDLKVCATPQRLCLRMRCITHAD